jgi:hypothetical protein
VIRDAFQSACDREKRALAIYAHLRLPAAVFRHEGFGYCEKYVNLKSSIAERYLVGQITPKGDHYLVEVFGVWGGQKKSSPDVVPELAFENGQWLFTNFHYGKTDLPVNESLLSVLQILKKDRRKNGK